MHFLLLLIQNSFSQREFHFPWAQLSYWTTLLQKNCKNVFCQNIKSAGLTIYNNTSMSFSVDLLPILLTELMKLNWNCWLPGMDLFLILSCWNAHLHPAPTFGLITLGFLKNHSSLFYLVSLKPQFHFQQNSLPVKYTNPCAMTFF